MGPSIYYLTIVLQGRYSYYPHFKDEDTEAYGSLRDPVRDFLGPVPLTVLFWV